MTTPPAADTDPGAACPTTCANLNYRDGRLLVPARTGRYTATQLGMGREHPYYPFTLGATRLGDALLTRKRRTKVAR